MDCRGLGVARFLPPYAVQFVEELVDHWRRSYPGHNTVGTRRCSRGQKRGDTRLAGRDQRADQREGDLIYWPRTREQFPIRGAAYAMARVQATLTS